MKEAGRLWTCAGSGLDNSANESGREIDKMGASRVEWDFQRAINLQVNSG